MLEMDGSIGELHREEARRLKAVAVEKYKAGDLVGAKEFAVKAQRRNPILCGLIRLNAVLDVRMGFARKINGEVDWYAVLSVDPTADLETIKEHYRKLSLDIILDDDNSVGSIEEANQILDDSWKYLCNENMKQLYDKRRKVQLQLQNVGDGGSFWTVCHSCSFQYKYPNFWKDKMIHCFHCCEPFRATEYPAPLMANDIPWTYEEHQRLKRMRESQVPSWMVSPVEPQVVVKKNLFHVTQVRRICAGAGIRRGKLVLPPNMRRGALLKKSESVITDEEMRGKEKRRRV